MASTSIEFRRPGVELREVNLPRDVGTVTVGQARAVLVGPTARGPEEPTVVPSWSEYQAIFGAWTGTLAQDRVADAAYSYFSNALSNASALIVVRAVNSDATPATKTLSTGVALTARSAGTWGNKLSVTLTKITTTTFNLKVDLLDTAVSEVFYNLSTNPVDRNYFVPLINAGSAVVKAEDKGSIALTNAAAESLAGATEGTSPNWAASLAKLDRITSPLLIYVAATSGSDVDLQSQAVGASYAAARGDSFAIVDVPLSSDTADKAVAASHLPTSSFSAAYFPWIVVSDPTRSVANALKTIPPGGAVLGAIASTDANYGPWRAPAGSATAVIRNAVDVTQVMSDADLAKLNSGMINVLRPISGVGVTIMGARTRNAVNQDRYVSVRRSLNYISANLRAIAETGLFEPNGTDLWERLSAQMNDWLGRYFQQGGLRGSREPEAFSVKINAANNTPSTIAAGELHIEVGVAVEFPAEFVIIRLVQYQTAVRND